MKDGGEDLIDTVREGRVEGVAAGKFDRMAGSEGRRGVGGVGADDAETVAKRVGDNVSGEGFRAGIEGIVDKGKRPGR